MGKPLPTLRLRSLRRRRSRFQRTLKTRYPPRVIIIVYGVPTVHWRRGYSKLIIDLPAPHAHRSLFYGQVS